MGNSRNGSVHFFFLLIATVPDTRVLDNNGNGNEYCFFLQYLSLLLMTDDWASGKLFCYIFHNWSQSVSIEFNTTENINVVTSVVFTIIEEWGISLSKGNLECHLQFLDSDREISSPRQYNALSDSRGGQWPSVKALVVEWPCLYLCSTHGSRDYWK